jgi:hypothetical protein
VSETGREWFNRVFTLATSLRNMGGSCAGAPMYVFYVSWMDDLHVSLLGSLGVTCRVVEKWPSTRPHANKLRMFENVELEPGSVLVALDCDVAILDDFSEVLPTTTVRATPAWESPMRPGRWLEVIDDMGLRPATAPFTMIGTGENVPVPYFNSGVMFIPEALVSPLKEAWAEYIERLDVGNYELDPETELYYLDQIALALALLKTEIPFEALGQEWHLHTKKDLDEAGVAAPGHVRIAEYHRWVEADGLLKPPRYAGLGPDISRLNAVLAARRNIPDHEGLVTKLGAVAKAAVAKAASATKSRPPSGDSSSIT